MKKFYKSVTIEQHNDGYRLFLDKKPVLTPTKNILSISSENLADAVRGEWQGQGDSILPETMSLSQFAMTLIDRVKPHRALLQAEILGFLDTDLICYYADEPEIYRLAQIEKWQIFHDKFKNIFDYTLKTTSGLSAISQSPEIHQAIEKYVSSLSNDLFLPLYLATVGAGSLVIGLCFVQKEVSVDDVINAAFAEETQKDKIYLSETYGSAPDQERRVKQLREELTQLQRYMDLL